MRMLDLFCGRWGWSKAFVARGWECVGIDLVEPPEIPNNCRFIRRDILDVDLFFIFGDFDFICASSPCEQFSVHGMKHFHPNPPYPEVGIKLFEHTRRICEESGVPYVMENVRAAQQFVGNAVHHCGPFYLWGTGVPPLLHRGITKNTKWGMPREWRQQFDPRYKAPGEPKRIWEPHGMTGTRRAWSGSKQRAELAAKTAEIPAELANAVADYAERLLEVRVV